MMSDPINPDEMSRAVGQIVTSLAKGERPVLTTAEAIAVKKSTMLHPNAAIVVNGTTHVLDAIVLDILPDLTFTTESGTP